MIINLISTPRNLSTALMYSFRERLGIKVIDEPFFANFLIRTGADRPARQETLQSQSSDWDCVLKEIESIEKEHKEVFLKNIANQIVNLSYEQLANWKNLIVIRDPKLILNSYIKQVENPIAQDIGLKEQRILFDRIKEIGSECILFDSSDLLQNPKKYLSLICEGIGIDFQESMLRWDAGPKPEDGIWAKYWYKSLHKSEGFVPYMKKEINLPSRVLELYKQSQEHYEYLKQFEILQDATEV